jgi:hypothetical protein
MNEDAEIYVGGKHVGTGLAGMVEALPEMLQQAHRARKVYKAKREPMTYEDWRKLGWDHEEAERAVNESPQTKTVCYVVVQTENGGGDVYELAHHKRHSPDGFEWGYEGSGPAELARCILIDYLDMHEQAENATLWDRVPPLNYQEFKRKFIAGAAKEGFTLDATEIEAWVQEQEALLSE